MTDIADDFQIPRLALRCAIEINDMQAGRAHRLPFQRDIQRVVGKLCFTFVITLVKPDAFTAFKVDGRYNFDGCSFRDY
jgi:hypothetical protein